jgi:hypothetical protein
MNPNAARKWPNLQSIDAVGLLKCALDIEHQRTKAGHAWTNGHQGYRLRGRTPAGLLLCMGTLSH